MNTPSQSSSSVSTSPAGAPAKAAAPSSALGENPADIKVPLSPAHKHRRGVVLAVLAVAWFALALFAASSAPGSGTLWKLIAGVSLLGLIGAWLAVAAWSLFLRRPMGVLGWAVAPAVVGIWLFLPWGNWFLSARVRAHENDLRSIAEQQSWIPEHKPREFDITCAGIRFEHATRIGSTIALAYSTSPDGESGLLFSPSDTAPTPPEWTRSHRETRIIANWFRYSWLDE